MLTVYRRHRPECNAYGKSRNARGSRSCRTRCPLWVQGSLRGEYVRRSLNLNSWEAASDLVRSWEASGHIGVVRAEIPTVREAVEKYLADGRGRNLSAESVKKLQDAVERLFLGFCTKERLPPSEAARSRCDPRIPELAREEVRREFRADAPRIRSRPSPLLSAIGVDRCEPGARREAATVGQLSHVAL